MSSPATDADVAAALGIPERKLPIVRALIAQLAGTDADGEPVSTTMYVHDAAKMLGISRDTLDEAITRLPEHRRPAAALGAGNGKRRRYYWPDAAALRAWWGEVTAPPPPPAGTKTAPRARSSRKPTLVGGAVTDWSAVTKSLTKENR